MVSWSCKAPVWVAGFAMSLVTTCIGVVPVALIADCMVVCPSCISCSGDEMTRKEAFAAWAASWKPFLDRHPCNYPCHKARNAEEKLTSSTDRLRMIMDSSKSTASHGQSKAGSFLRGRIEELHSLSFERFAFGMVLDKLLMKRNLPDTLSLFIDVSWKW